MIHILVFFFVTIVLQTLVNAQTGTLNATVHLKNIPTNIDRYKISYNTKDQEIHCKILYSFLTCEANNDIGRPRNLTHYWNQNVENLKIPEVVAEKTRFQMDVFPFDVNTKISSRIISQTNGKRDYDRTTEPYTIFVPNNETHKFDTEKIYYSQSDRKPFECTNNGTYKNVQIGLMWQNRVKMLQDQKISTDDFPNGMIFFCVAFKITRDDKLTTVERHVWQKTMLVQIIKHNEKEIENNNNSPNVPNAPNYPNHASMPVTPHPTLPKTPYSTQPRTPYPTQPVTPYSTPPMTTKPTISTTTSTTTKPTTKPPTTTTPKPTTTTTPKPTTTTTPKPTTSTTTKPTTRRTTKPTTKRTTKPTTKRTTKPTTKRTTKPTTKRTTKPTTRRTTKPTTTTTSKPTTTTTSKPTSYFTITPISNTATKTTAHMTTKVSNAKMTVDKPSYNQPSYNQPSTMENDSLSPFTNKTKYYMATGCVGIIILIASIVYVACKKRHKKSPKQEKVQELELETYATSALLYAELRLDPAKNTRQVNQNEETYAQIVGVLKPREAHGLKY